MPPLGVIVARELAFTTVAATAAATLIGPLDVEALGAASLEAGAPLALARESALERSPPTRPSTPPGEPPDEPEAVAAACGVVVDGPVAVNVTGPVIAVKKRAVVASAVWFAKVRATEAPTAAVPPVLALPAVVFAVAVVPAAKVIAPVVRVPGPRKACALDATFEIATATAGASAKPPAAPVRASVVMVFAPVALRVRSLTPPSDAPRPSSARVRSSTMFRATEAPMPEPVVPARAFASDVDGDVAIPVTARPPASAAPLIVAALASFAMVSANEPAKLTP